VGLHGSTATPGDCVLRRLPDLQRGKLAKSWPRISDKPTVPPGLTLQGQTEPRTIPVHAEVS
jgi:hypothetical protein